MSKVFYSTLCIISIFLRALRPIFLINFSNFFFMCEPFSFHASFSISWSRLLTRAPAKAVSGPAPHWHALRHCGSDVVLFGFRSREHFLKVFSTRPSPRVPGFTLVLFARLLNIFLHRLPALSLPCLLLLFRGNIWECLRFCMFYPRLT